MTHLQEFTRVNVERTSNDIPVRNIWYMLCYALDDRMLQHRFNAQTEEAPSIDAMLAKLLLALFSRRLRIGLGHDYRNHEETVNGIRGRVDFGTSIKKMSFQNAKAHCRYQVFDSNVLKNQIIKSTLTLIAKRGDFGPDKKKANEQKKEIQLLVRQLPKIDEITVTPSIVRRKLIDREDYDYRTMLTLCNLILSRDMPTEESGNSASQLVNRDWKFVCYLYESFVVNFLKHHIDAWETTAQMTVRWPGEDQTSYLPIMMPDIVMRHKESSNRVILDTKLTAKSLSSSGGTFDTKHLYQIYSYLRSQEDQWGKMTGVLLYPTAKYELHESTEMHGHCIRWESVDLAQSWPKIEADLIMLAASLDATVPV